MVELEVGGKRLAHIHRVSNDKKYFCYFTGFLEGVAASGRLEPGEVEPLLAQCNDFVANINDGDANDILEDFKCEILELASIVDCIEVRSSAIDKTCEKSSLNSLLGFCAGIACDDQITLSEAKTLLERLEASDSFANQPILRALATTCSDALEDGEISNSESIEICSIITALVGDCYADTGLSALGQTAIFKCCGLDPSVEDFDQATFVLTGNFELRPRRLIEDAIVEKNGRISKTVSSGTDYLVIAAEASRDWVATHRGGKIIKADDLRSKVGRPNFLSEAALLKNLSISVP
jgi:hypothetical protein